MRRWAIRKSESKSSQDRIDRSGHGLLERHQISYLAFYARKAYHYEMGPEWGGIGKTDVRARLRADPIMPVKQGRWHMIELTDAATNELKQVMEDEKNRGKYLRIFYGGMG